VESFNFQVSIWLYLLAAPWLGLAGFCLLPARRARWISYLLVALAWVAAKAADLSFTIPSLNVLFDAVMVYMFCEMIWVSTLSRRKLMLAPTILAISVIYLATLGLVAAALAGGALYVPEETLSVKELGIWRYSVTHEDPSGALAHWRVFSLYSQPSFFPVRRRLGIYSTGERGYDAEYELEWHTRGHEASVDLMVDDSPVYRLGPRTM